MKIIHVVNRFVPDAGSQLNLLAKYEQRYGNEVTVIAPEFSQSHKSYVEFYSNKNIKKRDEQYTQKTGVAILRLRIHRYISGRALFKKDVYHVIEDSNPDVLFIHGNDTLIAMHYIRKISKLHSVLVLDSHMVEIASKNKFRKLFRTFYKSIYAPIINKHKIPVIRMQDDDYVEKCLGVDMSNAPFISVGSDPDLFHPDKSIYYAFRKENNIESDAFVVLYAGKLDKSKGGLFLAKSIREKFSSDKEVVFVIVGNTSGEYGEIVDIELKKSENRVIRFPTQKYIGLPKFYQSADLVVYPKQCSLSFYDAQACGLPVLFENINVNRERAKYNTAFTFQSDNMIDFRKKMNELVSLSSGEMNKIRDTSLEYINKDYNYRELSKKYLNVMEAELKRKALERNKRNG